MTPTTTQRAAERVGEKVRAPGGRERTTSERNPGHHNPAHRGALIGPGTLLGIGLGGFADGILFHQILQWHNMLSSVVAPTDLVAMKYNIAWDGLFHAFTWVMTVVGLALLWRAGERANVPWSTRTFLGSLLLGWGLFNLVEGIIDHQILGLHHVHPGENQLGWDLAFLVFGALSMALGWTLIRMGRQDATPRGGGYEPAPPMDANVPRHVTRDLGA
jgi:uncharacterized membrane protein